MLDRLLEFVNKEEIPNKFTRYWGERMREAREELGMSQAELAEHVYKRRPSITDMENGKMYPDISTAILIAIVLAKPLAYFVHPAVRSRDAFPELESLTTEEMELLAYFRRIPDDQQRLAVNQVKAVADYLK